MRKFLARAFMALVLVAAPLGVAACSTVAGLVGQQSAATYDEKALIAAELAFDATTSAIVAADRAGALTPERAAAVLPRYQEARAAILRARAAYDANEQAEAAIATGDAVAAVSVLAGLLVDLGLIERN